MGGTAEFDDKLNALLSNPDSMAQIMQLAQSLSGGTGGQQPAAPPPAQPAPVQTAAPVQAAGVVSPGFSSPGPDLFSMLGGIDPKIIAKLLPLVQELGSQQNSNARALLYAMRPYLKAERQEKVERALQLARLFHLGRKFLAGWEG